MGIVRVMCLSENGFSTIVEMELRKGIGSVCKRCPDLKGEGWHSFF